jgi:hypothetical protein
MVRDSIPPEKEEMREQIKRQTEKFLANGGKIKKVEFGKYGKDLESQEFVPSGFNERHAK